jgi:hypothetical protein
MVSRRATLNRFTPEDVERRYYSIGKRWQSHGSVAIGFRRKVF